MPDDRDNALPGGDLPLLRDLLFPDDPHTQRLVEYYRNVRRHLLGQVRATERIIAELEHDSSSPSR